MPPLQLVAILAGAIAIIYYGFSPDTTEVNMSAEFIAERTKIFDHLIVSVGFN